MPVPGLVEKSFRDTPAIGGTKPKTPSASYAREMPPVRFSGLSSEAQAGAPLSFERPENRFGKLREHPLWVLPESLVVLEHLSGERC